MNSKTTKAKATKVKATKAKIIKGSGETKSSQSYLSFDNPNQQEIVFKPLKSSPSKNSLKILAANKSFKLSPIIEEERSNREQSSMSPINEEDISYTSNIPPKKFTYKKLVKMFYAELLNKEAIKLENNAEEIAEEIVIKIKKEDKTDNVKKRLADYSEETILSAFNEIIGKKIDETIKNVLRPINKEYEKLLIKKLWDVLYKANFGYVAEYKTFDEYLVTVDINNAIQDKLKQDEFFADFKRDIEQDKFFIDFIKSLEIKTIKGGMPGARTSSPGRRRRGAQPMVQPMVQDNEFCEYDFSQRDASIWQKIMLTSRYFIIPWKNLLLSVFKEIFVSPGWGRFTRPWKSRIDNKRIELRDKIISSYKNDLDKQAIVKAEFEIIDNDPELIKLINKSIWERILMDWRINHYQQYPDRKIDNMRQDIFIAQYCRNQTHSQSLMIYRPFDDCPIYGMRLKDRFSRKDMLRSMLYLLRNIEDLKVFVNLNDCETSVSPISTIQNCNPYDRCAEREVFEIAVRAHKGDGDIYHNHGIIYLSIKNFEDMKAGNLLDWYQLSKIPPAYLNQKIVINSANGLKTTGTVLLFLRLRDAQEHTDADNFVKNGLIKIYFGNKNILELLSIFEDFFKNIKIDLKEAYHNMDYEAEHKHVLEIKEELKEVTNDIFGIKFIWQIKLLRQRLNRIFYFLAKKHNIKEFYLYTSHRSSKYYQPTYDNNVATDQHILELFSLPFKVKIDWDRIGAENWSVIWELHQKYVDGIIDQHYYLGN